MTNTSETNLCDRCRGLDLESYVELQVKQGRGTIAYIEKASLRKHCELCIQFGHIFTALKAVRTRVSNHDSFTLDYRHVQVEGTDVVYFRVRFMEFQRVLDFDFDFFPTTAMIQDAWSLDAPLPVCKPMGGCRAELGLARQWLQRCQSLHEPCQRSQVWSHSLRVLDCADSQLVHIDSSKSYACLSYVWGAQSAQEKSKSSSGLQSVPQTIKDAMSVCVALGIQYFWVDRYCIDQDNAEERRHLISNMDKIYQGADLTIIASAGQDPHHGLPGVLDTRRRPQLYLKAGRYTFASTENLREQITTSTWNSRGWTYQEMALSQRRLVFTDSQMFFECQCSRYLESLDIAATATSSPLADRYMVFPLLHKDIETRIDEYYPRYLSISSDVLHAFTGVCNATSRWSSKDHGDAGFSHFYGIPVQRHRSKLILQSFLRDLAWRVMHRETVSKPPDFPLAFPTWSWASPKSRHCSQRSSGEYVQPPDFEVPASQLNAWFITKSGTILDSTAVLVQSLEYSDFHPCLLLDGHLLTGSFTTMIEGQSKSGSIYLDSYESLDVGNLAALYLGNNKSGISGSWLPSCHRTHRIICLLVQRLKPEEELPYDGMPHLVKSMSYRRMGLWIQDLLGDWSPEPSKLMDAVCANLNALASRDEWRWSQQSITLL